MNKKPPNILLINPWVYDFAAHDLWSKPLGLLLLGGLLRVHGYNLRLVDCLDIHDPRLKEVAGMKPATRRGFGTGKFYRTEVAKPNGLEQFERPYYRFGITAEIFQDRLLDGPKPDVVLVTSTMTYWYPGVLESIRLVKKHFSDVPVVLGGIYATLCHEHAVRRSGADHVLSGPGENRILHLLEKLTGHSSKKPSHTVEVNTLPWPAFDLLPHLQYVCILTSRGCPFHCPYCASDLLFPKFVRRDPIEVVDELEHWHQKYSNVNVAFYDDALLLDPGKHILVLLNEVRRRGLPLQFHTPNGVHVSGLTEEVCESLFLSGFKTLRLGLETTDHQRQHQLGDKVKPGAFSTAMENLTRAGFQADQIGIYLLCGLPGQELVEVAESIRMVRDLGARPYLAEYSPIPGTPLWSEALRSSPFDLVNEPLYHNNSILPCRSERFGLEELQQLKQLCRI
ncbi:MAG: cobalamin-dependent protein [Syntrophobacterales bacterium]|jgi:radical SAM superfamily enzyme YgiQ (UPF0313 family)